MSNRGELSNCRSNKAVSNLIAASNANTTLMSLEMNDSNLMDFPTFENDEFFTKTPSRQKKKSLLGVPSKRRRLSAVPSTNQIVQKPTPVQQTQKLSARFAASQSAVSQSQPVTSFSDDLAPDDVEDLVVNAKKISEVRNWVLSRVRDGRGGCLLLTGPPGCGKASVLRLLCDELDIDLMEFESEQRIKEVFTEDYESRFIRDGCRIESVTQSFLDFILDSGSRSVETQRRTRKMIYIREIPHQFIKRPEELRLLLRNVVPNLRHFLIFALTLVESNWELNPNRLFPENDLNELNIQHIKFNPIPKTVMTKCVKNWIEKLNLRNKMGFVNSIVERADGDLRSAKYLLGMQKAFGQNIDFKTLFGADPRMELFHFIGKIMYSKRTETPNFQWSATEKRIRSKSHRRPHPPKDDLNELAESAPVGGWKTLDYVTDHELHFSSDIKRCAKIYEDLCGLDSHGSDFRIRIDRKIENIVLKTTIRSVLYNNYDAVKKPGKAYQFTKPANRDYQFRRRELLVAFNESYPTHNFNDTMSFTLPLLPLLNCPLSYHEHRLLTLIDPNAHIDLQRTQFQSVMRPVVEIAE